MCSSDLLKLDKKSGQALGGAKFVVTDSKGKEVMKFVTKDEAYDITGCIFQKYLSTFFFIYPHTKGLPSETSSECMAD